MTTAFIGAGAWGTTLALIASENTDVILYTRDATRAAKINETRINDDYLPGIVLPEKITVTSDPQSVAGADHIVFAIPSIAFRETVDRFSFIDKHIPFVSVTKGLEQSTNLRMSQVIEQTDPDRDSDKIAVVSGPNLAGEIAIGLPAATVVASRDSAVATSIQKTLMTKKFRVYTSDDVVGCEIAGVAKNIVAIAVGIGDGLKYGDNAKAAVMTRALAEITRLGVAEGGEKSTFSGLAGIGDLIATCASPLSRNRTVGYLLAQGKSLDEIRDITNETAEGVFSAVALKERAQHFGVDAPIITAVANVIESGVISEDAVEQLMTRPAAKE